MRDYFHAVYCPLYKKFRLSQTTLNTPCWAIFHSVWSLWYNLHNGMPIPEGTKRQFLNEMKLFLPVFQSYMELQKVINVNGFQFQMRWEEKWFPHGINTDVKHMRIFLTKHFRYFRLFWLSLVYFQISLGNNRKLFKKLILIKHGSFENLDNVTSKPLICVTWNLFTFESCDKRNLPARLRLNNVSLASNWRFQGVLAANEPTHCFSAKLDTEVWAFCRK